MSVRSIEDVDTYEGSIDGDKFCDFVQRCLVPILQPFNGMNESTKVQNAQRLNAFTKSHNACE